MSHIAPLALALLLAACGGQRAQAGLGAGSGGPSRPGHGLRGGETARSLDADPELAADRRALVMRSVEAADGRRATPETPLSDAALLGELYGPLRLDAAPRTADDAESWVAASRPRQGRPRPGDLAVFQKGRDVPRIAVVVAVAPDGLVTGVALTRGAYRRIRVHPGRTHVRRDDGLILNTFLRPRRPDDPRRQRYLAGELLEGFRTLLD